MSGVQRFIGRLPGTITTHQARTHPVPAPWVGVQHSFNSLLLVFSKPSGCRPCSTARGSLGRGTAPRPGWLASSSPSRPTRCGPPSRTASACPARSGCPVCGTPSASPARCIWAATHAQPTERMSHPRDSTPPTRTRSATPGCPSLAGDADARVGRGAPRLVLLAERHPSGGALGDADRDGERKQQGLQVLTGPHDQRADGAVFIADVDISGAAGVAPLIDLDSEVVERGRAASAYGGGRLPRHRR